jgi:hypothetical protein
MVDQQKVLLMLLVAVALAAYHGHKRLKQADLTRAGNAHCRDEACRQQPNEDEF